MDTSTRCVEFMLAGDPTVSTSAGICEGRDNLDSTTRLGHDSVANNMLPPCRVCGEKATGLHYGVISCEACKSFYRRSFKRKKKLECITGKGMCVVTSDVNVCPYCRHAKCIGAGMSKDAIKIGRYTYERKTRNTLEFKGELTGNRPKSGKLSNEGFKKLPSGTPTTFDKRAAGEITCENVPAISLDSLTIRSTEGGVDGCERAEIERIIELLAEASERLNPYASVTQSRDELERTQTEYYELCTLKAAVFGNLNDLSQAEHEAFYRSTGIDLDDRDKKMAIQLEDACSCAMSMINFAKLIPGFKQIDREDQISLLKGSFSEYWAICSLKYVHKEFLVEATLSGGLAMCGEYSFLLSQEYQAQFKSYVQAASKLSLSNTTWAIIKAITLTFPDRSLMKNRDQVERVQNPLIDCLQYTLSLNHERPKEILAKIVDLFLRMRNLTEFDYKIGCEMLSWPITQRYPLLCELLSTTPQ